MSDCPDRRPLVFRNIGSVNHPEDTENSGRLISEAIEIGLRNESYKSQVQQEFNARPTAALANTKPELSTCRPVKNYFNSSSGSFSDRNVNLKINLKPEPVSFHQKRLPKIAESLNSPWHIVDPEIIDFDSALKLLPCDGG